MKLAVLNEGGRDREQLFPDGPGQPGCGPHAPINYHAYAACTGGGFYASWKRIPADANVVLILLRRRIGPSLRALTKLKELGKTCWISWKESGLFQVGEALADAAVAKDFFSICALADGFVSSTPDLVPLYRSCGLERGDFIPTPYPLEFTSWDFSADVDSRCGVFIGTREFTTPSRNHFSAVLGALRVAVDQPVTAIVCGKGEERRLAKELSGRHPSLQVVAGPLSYENYLRLMASHRVVFQLDRSRVPGQAAGDALLCGLPCIGGDGAVESLAFPGLSGRSNDDGCLLEILSDLLRRPGAAAESGRQARERAGELLGFQSVANRLAALMAE